MKVLLLVMFSLLGINGVRLKDTDLVSIRTLFYDATTSQKKCEQFETVLKGPVNLKSEFLKGYTGMCYMLKAKFAWNPYSKLSYFFKGKNYLEDAILTSTSSVELRFLRFSVQTNVPAILNYSGKIEEDKKIILGGYAAILDSDLKRRIKEFMRASNFCTHKEKEFFK